jgi:hypothetical protein
MIQGNGRPARPFSFADTVSPLAMLNFFKYLTSMHYPSNTDSLLMGAIQSGITFFRRFAIAMHMIENQK